MARWGRAKRGNTPLVHAGLWLSHHVSVPQRIPMLLRFCSKVAYDVFHLWEKAGMLWRSLGAVGQASIGGAQPQFV